MMDIETLLAAEDAALAELRRAQAAYDAARNAVARAYAEIDRRAAKSRGARLGDANA